MIKSFTNIYLLNQVNSTGRAMGTAVTRNNSSSRDSRAAIPTIRLHTKTGPAHSMEQVVGPITGDRTASERQIRTHRPVCQQNPVIWEKRVQNDAIAVQSIVRCFCFINWFCGHRAERWWRRRGDRVWVCVSKPGARSFGGALHEAFSQSLWLWERRSTRRWRHSICPLSARELDKLTPLPHSDFALFWFTSSFYFKY